MIKIIQKITGISAAIMFLINALIALIFCFQEKEVDWLYRDSILHQAHWHIFGMSIFFFVIALLIVFMKREIAGVFLLPITGFSIYVLVDSCIFSEGMRSDSGLLFHNLFSSTEPTILGNVFGIVYTSFMFIGFVFLTVLAFMKPKSKMIPTTLIGVVSPAIMIFFFVLNYLFAPVFYRGGLIKTILKDVVSFYLVLSLFMIMSLVLLSVSMILANQLAKERPQRVRPVKIKENEEDSMLDEDSYKYIRRLPRFIFLSFITFGIYRLVWLYKTTRFVNQYTSAGRKRDPFTSMLFCLIPGYYPYWAYNTIKSIQAENDSLDSSFNCILPFVGLICPLVCDLYIQNTINTYILGTDEAEYVDFASARRGVFKVLILTAVTGGIYGLVWQHKISKLFRHVSKTRLTPGGWTVLSIFFPPANIWWAANVCEVIDRCYNTQKCTPFIMASSICPPLMYAVVQDRINELGNLQ